MPESFDFAIVGGGIVGSALAVGLQHLGQRVAILERGAAKRDQLTIAEPRIKLTRNAHLGATRLRNHVLGGNGAFWGGGLMRPPSTFLASCLGESAADSEVDLADCFASVEKRLNFRLPDRQPHVSLPSGEQFIESPICVLPGKRRNISMSALNAADRAAIYLGCGDVRFVSCASAGALRVERIDFLSNCQRQSIHAANIVISAGAIDSNFLIQDNADQLGLKALKPVLGSRLHDHYSVPIARFSMPPSRHALAQISPTLEEGLVYGRHFEIALKRDWGPAAFLHFQFPFDSYPPYAEIKHVLEMRQRSVGAMALALAALPLLRQLPALAQILRERMISGRLHLPTGMPITVTLDFESYPRPEQALKWNGTELEFAWDFSPEDEDAFLAFCRSAGHWLAGLESSLGTRIVSLFHHGEGSEYFRANAVDALHLGGGLASSPHGRIVNQDFRLQGVSNLYVISSAVMDRPGVVNPTHTLLALAERFVSSMAKADQSAR